MRLGRGVASQRDAFAGLRCASNMLASGVLSAAAETVVPLG
jgi:hypothetical protein